MSNNYTLGDDVLVQKKPCTKTAFEKELAEELLQSEGYVPSPKPRRVNGGGELASARHTESNKARLNSTLSKTPAQARRQVHDEGKNASRAKKRHAMASPVYTKREKAATPFPLSYIFYIGILTVILVYIVHLYIEIADLDSAVVENNNKLVELRNEQNTLISEKNKLYGRYREEAEEIARTQYGMVSADQIPNKYRDTDSGDTIDIIETAEERSAAGVLMSGFGRAVSNFLSYIN